ncbi:MAG: arginase family protein [Aeromicrobium sp.]
MSARSVEVIAVPFDGFGRAGHQADAADAYLDAGLLDRPDLAMELGPPIRLPAPSPARGPLTGLMNEDALLALTDELQERVAACLRDDRFPVVVGGDCSLLLGTFAGAHAVDDGFGLLFADGHEDTTPLDVSEDGEAANVELGLLLGVTGRRPGFPRPAVLSILDPSRLAALGQRDVEWRRSMNVASVADLGTFLRSAESVADDPGGVGRDAGARLQIGGPWWLHVDLDVLDLSVLPATGVPGEAPDPDSGGLVWEELTTVLTSAVDEGGCRGLSVAIYDPEQDPGRRHAGRVVELVHALLEALTGSRRRIVGP